MKCPPALFERVRVGSLELSNRIEALRSRRRFNTFGRSLEDLGIFWWLVARRLPSRLRLAVYELLHRNRR